MDAQTVVVEAYALSNMNSALRKLGEAVRHTLEAQNKAIDATRRKLEASVQSSEQAVKAAVAAYQTCRNYVDEEGYPPPCSAEVAAIRAAEAELAEARQQLIAFNDAASEYQAKVGRSSGQLDSMIIGARADLDGRIGKIMEYLSANPVDPALMRTWVPGSGTHGSLYQRARQEYYERATAGEYPTLGSDIQGWMSNEVRRGTTRSPYSRGTTRDTGARTIGQYDLGHQLAGLDIPENFRGWEIPHNNRGWPSRARAAGIHPMFW